MTSKVKFQLATEEDDAAIRQLLHEPQSFGKVRLTFQREPSYFLGDHLLGEKDKTILAYEGDRLIGMGRCATQPRFVNGERKRVGYLGELRLAPSAQGRYDVLRRGYQFFRKLQDEDSPDFYFTKIPAENKRSIRFLAKGLPGLPKYTQIGSLKTLLVPVPRNADKFRKATELKLKGMGRSFRQANSDDVSSILALLNAQAKRHHLAMFWTIGRLLALRHVGLDLSDFILIYEGKALIGCAGLWDQRSFKQIVIHSYARKLSLTRPIRSLLSRVTDSSPIPKAGRPVAQAFLSPIAANDPFTYSQLAELGLVSAAERKLEFMTLGSDERDERLSLVEKNLTPHAYLTPLYRVQWGKADGPGEEFDARLFLPEVSFL